MWSEREREELAVWADGLQVAGDPLGELVTTSLLLDATTKLAEASPFARDDRRLETLQDRVAALEAQVRQPILDGVLAECPELQPSWAHGMIVALRVVDHPLGRRLGHAALDSLRTLLRLPVARFLRTLRVDARELDWTPIHREVPSLLIEPEVLARPWTVVLGAPPRHMRRHAPADAFEGIRARARIS